MYCKELLVEDRKIVSISTQTLSNTHARVCVAKIICNYMLFGKITLKKVVIYKALCFDVAQGRMNGAPNEKVRKKRVQKDVKVILFIYSDI